MNFRAFVTKRDLEKYYLLVGLGK